MDHLIESVMDKLIPIVIQGLEAMGVIIIFIAGIIAFYKYGMNLLIKKDYSIKIQFAEAMTLALEFKMGAEILKTVIVRTLDEMYILAAIIILRAILAVVIHWEIKAANNERQLKKIAS